MAAVPSQLLARDLRTAVSPIGLMLGLFRGYIGIMEKWKLLFGVRGFRLRVKGSPTTFIIILQRMHGEMAFQFKSSIWALWVRSLSWRGAQGLGFRGVGLEG